jgi:serine/threonine protein kinase/tetratricopeptide (TPR) repeat protein
MRATRAMTTELQAGARLGRYKIISRLGAGGMGDVFLAEDTKLGRKVALKILRAESSADAARAQRFIREAKTASNLNHPNILTVFESDEESGFSYIATEYVEGETVRGRVRRGAMTVRETLDVAVQVASALAAAHRAGVVHRDIKPENVMIRTDGYVKVLDFGIAKLLQASTPSAPSPNSASAPTEEFLNTEQGLVLGTVAYMSPEQARGLAVDARTDIWSLGCILYEMLAGRAPFGGPTRADVVASILHDEPRAVLPPDVADELGRIVSRALAKDRDARYQTCDELLADLRRMRGLVSAGTGASQQTGATLAHSPVSHATTPISPDTPLTQHSTEQRRHVTVLFADLSPLSELFESLDEEELGEVSGALWRRVEKVIGGHGGRVERHMGDELMALWGAAGAREDDPESAVRAALALRDEVSEFARGSLHAMTGAAASGARESAPVRVGLNTGPVLMGASLTGEVAATGGAVVAARRLKNSAPAGSILISHDTYRHVRGVFDVQEAGGDTAAEMTTTTTTGTTTGAVLPSAYEVLGARPRAFRLRTRGVEGVETRMVGRRSELKRLTDALETVFEDRELQAVTLLGDAGLGKSRLLYEFASKVEVLPDAWQVFQGRASEATQASPYALIREMLALRFDIQDSDPAAEARQKLERGLVEMSTEAGSATASEAQMRAHFIGQLAGLDFSSSEHLSGILDDAQQIRDRAFHYAAQFLAGLAARTPVLLMLDDIHWADDGSLDFVDHLTRACTAAPLMLLCAARPVLIERRPHWGEGQSAHTTVELQPLSRRESRQLVEEILRLAGQVPSGLRELVVGRAEGNPFFVEELIKMLIEEGAILPGADEWAVDASRLGEVQVPPTLTGVLQARLDRLDPRERTALQRASVLGREFWDAAVEHLCEDDSEGAGCAGRARELLQSLRRKELVYEREASGLAGASEYVFKHALLRDVTYETLLKRDRRRLHRRAAEWLAAQSGARVGEYAGAIAEHYERAGESAAAAEWYGRAGRQARESYAPDAAVRFFGKAVEMLKAASERGGTEEDPRARHARAAQWCEGLGDVLWRQARLDEALEAFDAMRAEARAAGDAAAEARAWNGRSLAEDGRGETRAALDSAREAEHLARAAPESAQARSALVTSLLRQGYAHYRLGGASAVIRLGEEALALASEGGEFSRRDRARSLHLLGTAHQMLGDSDRALSFKERSLALVRELGDRQRVGAMLNGLGETARLRGDYRAASELYREALAIAREIGNLSQQLVYLGNLGGARVGEGEFAAAEADLREVVRAAGPAGHFALSEVYRFLAEALLGQGKRDEALDAARYALTLGKRTGNLEFIGGAWRALGLVAAALGGPVEAEGEGFTADDCFSESLRVYAEAGMESERARVLRDRARSEQAAGDAPAAAATLAEAREIFSRLGMTLELERTEV